MDLGMIWAQDATGGIGSRGNIPWNIPEDMKFFRENTLNTTVIMGRNTWDSLPQNFSPLPGRNNIVVTSTPLEVEKVFKFANPDMALDFARRLGKPFWVIGGATLYNYFLPEATKILVTEIDVVADCDVFAPKLTEPEWTVANSTAWKEAKNGHKFRFLEYKSNRGGLR